MYKVIEAFTDIQDNNRPYSAGDTYPRKGFNVSEKRLAELSGNANRRKKPLIEKVKDAVKDDVKDNVKDKPAPKRTAKRK